MGAVLLQDDQPVAYASKALTASQQLYPQIQKEATAIKFGCEKFREYIIGRRLIIETDHKPLEIIFKKPIHNAPSRLQKILFEISQYDPLVIYKKGKDLTLADILSRDCLNDPITEEDSNDTFICEAIAVGEKSLSRLTIETKKDETLQELIRICQDGWPVNKQQLPASASPYWTFRDEIFYENGILLKGNKIIIPKSMQKEMLIKIHQGHLGVQRCLQRARELMFWNHMSKDITDFVQSCSVCQSYQTAKTKEPLIIKNIPSLPWEIVAVDIFQFKNKDYLLIIDSYSGFFDFTELKNLSSEEVIKHLKKWFAVHGIPVKLESDNGTQFVSHKFRDFLTQWNIQSQTSSPRYARSNGLAERYVQTAKGILHKCSRDNSDVYLALLNYRNTPRDSELRSPAQRLMNRHTRTLLPTLKETLKPKVIQEVPTNLLAARNESKRHFDRHVKESSSVSIGDRVRLQTGHREWVTGIAEKKASSPRSFYIRTDDGKLYRRNTIHIHPTTSTIPTQKEVAVQPSHNTEVENRSMHHEHDNSTIPCKTSLEQREIEPVAKSRYGRIIRPVDRYVA